MSGSVNALKRTVWQNLIERTAIVIELTQATWSDTQLVITISLALLDEQSASWEMSVNNVKSRRLTGGVFFKILSLSLCSRRATRLCLRRGCSLTRHIGEGFPIHLRFDKSPTFSAHLHGRRRRMRRTGETKHRKVPSCVEDATC